MRGQPYSPARLYVDGIPDLEPGHYLRTVPGGSVYYVTHVTPHRTRPNRRNLRVLRWPPDELEATATVHALHWYPRKAKRARRIADLPRSTRP